MIGGDVGCPWRRPPPQDLPGQQFCSPPWMTRSGASRRRAAAERVAGRERAAVAAIAGLGGYEATACFKDEAGPLSMSQFTHLQARIRAFGRPLVGLADGPGNNRSAFRRARGLLWGGAFGPTPRLGEDCCPHRRVSTHTGDWRRPSQRPRGRGVSEQARLADGCRRAEAGRTWLGEGAV